MANAIKKALPEHEVLLREDKEHVPYGTKPIEQVHGFVLPNLQSMVDDGCEVIVIACNTVTTTLINQLRQELTVPLVGIEPMVKPAAAITKSGVIAVCATPATLASERYAWLKSEYAQGIAVVEPDCSDWSAMIETNQIDRQKITQRIGEALNQSADVIVLGCTHYHWIEDLISQQVVGRAEVLQPEQAAVARLQDVLRGLLPNRDSLHNTQNS